MKKIEKYAIDFNLDERYYGLFACIITGRSWDAINQGIDKVKFTPSEGLQIKAEASKYLREISLVLNLIPREMLLLLKTNDLLRGLETSLNTRNSSSSFIHLTKCCIRQMHEYERDAFKSNEHRTLKRIEFDFLSHLKQSFQLLNVYLYELFMKFFFISFK